MIRTTIIFAIAILLMISSCKKDGGNDGGGITSIDTSTNISLVTLTESDYRPVYHFTPPHEWMNDPNGLVYYNGHYHLFYQYNPDASVWGSMNWGHATSTDLFNWQDFPIALTPDNLGTIFSGSAVVDVNNTAGFKNGNEDVMVAIFTSNGTQQSQSIAYSTDAGLIWTKYVSNPVLPNPGVINFRDPKVFWYSAGQKWVMVLAVGNKISIYSSNDLKNWNFESDFGENRGAHGGTWECPDLFELQVEGTSTTKWVLIVSTNPGGPNGGSATQYFIGNFDGKNFTSDTNNISWIDYGTDNYAGVTYNNIPLTDGRRIMIGWMSNWNYASVVPTNSWRSTMTVPRVISLVNSGQGVCLNFKPVDELKTYETNTLDTIINSLVDSVQLINNKIIKSGSYEIDFSVDFSNTNSLTLTLGNTKEKLVINFNKATGWGYIDRSGSGAVDFNTQFANKINCPFVPVTGLVTDFQVLVDKTSIELFLNNGKTVMTALFFPKFQYNSLKIQGDIRSPVISNFSLKGINKSILR